MNLWAKSLGRLAMFAVALFFFSCEDESSFLGFKNPRPKFNVSYVEIPLESSVLLIDSVLTDNWATSGGSTALPFNAVGRYDDASLGSIKAETYLQLTPSSTSKLEESAVYDSLTFQVRLDFYAYGFSGDQEMEFNVHQITGEPLHLDTLRKRYYFNSAIAYNPEPLGQARGFVNYDSLKEQRATSGQDTVLLAGRLDNTFGNYLFNLAKTDPGSMFSDPYLFIQEVKGLVITPTQNNGILGLNAQSTLSKVVLHYHTMEGSAVADTLQKSFVFNGDILDANFTNYTADRLATELAPVMQPYQSFAPPSGFRAVQSGSPVITKLDLLKFYEFADTLDNVIVNSAELVISDVQSPSGIDPHESLMMMVMNNYNDRFTTSSNAADSTAMLPYHLLPSGRYLVASDLSSSQASLDYDSDNDQLSGFVTLFVQSLFRNKTDAEGVNESRIRFLGLHPMSPGISTSVNRTVFNSNNIKLRIYYTRPAAGSNNNN